MGWSLPDAIDYWDVLRNGDRHVRARGGRQPMRTHNLSLSLSKFAVNASVSCLNEFQAIGVGVVAPLRKTFLKTSQKWNNNIVIPTLTFVISGAERNIAEVEEGVVDRCPLLHERRHEPFVANSDSLVHG